MRSRSSQARIRRISCISSDSLFLYSGYTTQSDEIPNALIMRQKTSMLGARFSFRLPPNAVFRFRHVPQSALVKSLSPFGSLSESTPFCLLFSLHLYRTLSVHLRHYSTKRAPGEKCRISSGILELTVPNIPAFLPYKKTAGMVGSMSCPIKSSFLPERRTYAFLVSRNAPLIERNVVEKLPSMLEAAAL